MKKISWEMGEFSGVKTKLMHENSAAKEILIAMSKGAVLADHAAPNEISVQVLKGSVKFGIGDEICELKPIEMVTVEAKVTHFVQANEDTIIRLSLAK